MLAGPPSCSTTGRSERYYQTNALFSLRLPRGSPRYGLTVSRPPPIVWQVRPGISLGLGVIERCFLHCLAEVGRTTFSGYLEILEDTLLAFRLPAFEAKLRLRERKHPKLYWVDPGLVRAAGNRPGERHPQERGTLFEGFMANVLRACRDYLGLFDEFYYWASATSKNAEVDFLLRREERFAAVEVKSSNKILDSHLKGLRACRDLQGLGKRILVYPGERVMKTADGIDIWPLSQFTHNLNAEYLWNQ